jgi:hypothetical protein
MNNEFGVDLEGNSWGPIKISRNVSGGTEENLRIAGVPTEIQAEHLPKALSVAAIPSRSGDRL